MSAHLQVALNGVLRLQVTHRGQKQAAVHEHPYIKVLRVYLSCFLPRPEADDSQGKPWLLVLAARQPIMWVVCGDDVQLFLGVGLPSPSRMTLQYYLTVTSLQYLSACEAVA